MTPIEMFLVDIPRGIFAEQTELPRMGKGP